MWTLFRLIKKEPAKQKQRKKSLFNSFQTKVHFPYPLETSENGKFPDIFRGYRNEILIWNEFFNARVYTRVTLVLIVSNRSIQYITQINLSLILKHFALQNLFLYFSLSDLSNKNSSDIATSISKFKNRSKWYNDVKLSFSQINKLNDNSNKSHVQHLFFRDFEVREVGHIGHTKPELA